MNDSADNFNNNYHPQEFDQQNVTATNSTNNTNGSNKFFGSKSSKIVLISGLLLVIMTLASVGYFIYSNRQDGSGQDALNSANNNLESSDIQMTKFTSDEKFHEYFQNSQVASFFGAELRNLSLDVSESAVSMGPQGQFGSSGNSESAQRFSATNVQVGSIDEPDILKTDGENIFFSGENIFIQPFIGLERSIAPAPDEPIVEESGTKVVQVFPPQNIQHRSDIAERGEMLLSGNNLVIFANNQIVGYNISDKANPSRAWNMDIHQNDETITTVITSRLYQDKIYVVTSTYVRGNFPCPIPLTTGVSTITVPCVDVFYPGVNVNADSTYTVLRIDPNSGVVEDSISFVGSTQQSVVYMSENSIYVTNTNRMDEMEIFSDFLLTELDDLLPQELTDRIRKISEYDISGETKMMEYQISLEKHLDTLSDEEKERIRGEMETRMENYMSRRSREMMSTIITRISVSDLEITSTGSVPGSPLNQFSLDEYQQNLRIATTSNSSFGAGSVNDVYILDQNLNQIGSILDLGLTERIYAVRFLGDKGYVVTFRQIDPFYVLDLSNPQAPELKGELKIPGFSAYLHPLENNRILGVGRENSSVKLSIFDVSDPNSPAETQNIIMEEFSSEVLNNHRAFLLDEQHKIFFMPAGNIGYVFNYADGLTQQVVIEDINAQRALYINDYLYIVGDKVVVLDENTWQEVARMEL